MSFICEEKALSKGRGMLPAFYKRILFINGIFHCGLMPIVQDDCFLASPVNSLSYVSLPLKLCLFLPWHTFASLLPVHDLCGGKVAASLCLGMVAGLCSL